VPRAISQTRHWFVRTRFQILRTTTSVRLRAQADSSNEAGRLINRITRLAADALVQLMREISCIGTVRYNNCSTRHRMNSFLRFTTIVVLTLCLFSCGKSKPMKGRDGGLNEALSTPSAFGEIRGTWDMSRIPYWFPLHLVEINRVWNLDEGQSVIAVGVIEIGARTNLVFGRCDGVDARGQQWPHGWFALQQGQKEIRFFTNKVDWQSALAQVGISNAVLLEPFDAWRSYWRDGNPSQQH
jgi:hypothetical protein